VTTEIRDNKKGDNRMESILDQSVRKLADIRENLESWLLRHPECEDVNGDVKSYHRYLSALDLELARLALKLDNLYHFI
ncbi:hypothetical protein LCGC14_2005060, partial [marine sediment metagenome]